MSYTLAPAFEQQFFDNLGAPLSGGLLSAYLSQTSTPTPTYRDAIGTPNAWPVVLDASGRAVIYLAALTYKLILTDALGNVIGPTMDPVTSPGIGSSGLGAVFAFGGQSSAPVTATSYPSGGYLTLQPGTAVFAEDPANLPGTYVLRLTGVTSGANTLSVAIVNLDLAPDTPLGTAATLSSSTGAGATSGLITFGTPGIVRNFGIKTKVDSGSAFCWGVTLVRLT